LFDFPGRRIFEWALLLPLAMPAYVLAYATTDALNPSGPVQLGLRAAFGGQGALWPDVRSLPFAVLLFVLALYPYAYVLVRASLAERAAPLMEAARLLGAGLRRRLFEVAIPLARPALAAGVLLALMETLADFGVGAYFGLTTFTTGIYKAWLVMNDGVAAASLRRRCLPWWPACCGWKRRAQERLRFATGRSGAAHGSDARLLQVGPRGSAALLTLCILPIVLGFVLPCLWLIYRVAQEAQQAEFGLPLQRFMSWATHTFVLAGRRGVGGGRDRAGVWRGAACRARSFAVAVAAGGAHGVAGLCGARGGDRGRHAGPAGPGAGTLARQRRRLCG
jgi:iron(III) transport system permease protein